MYCLSLKNKCQIFCEIFFLLINAHFLSCQIQDGSKSVMDGMKIVKDKILKDYDKNIRPTNVTNTTSVRMYFMPRQILELDEGTALFKLDAFIWLRWYDERLKWDPSIYNEFLELPQDLLWKPDLFVFNSHSVNVNPAHDVSLEIEHTGQVSYLPPIHTQTVCPSVSENPYPGDEVTCEIVMGSWVHDGWEIDFKRATITMQNYEDMNPRWELISSKIESSIIENFHPCCPEPYTSLHFHFPMKRRPVPEIEATRAPCILVMILSLCVFWLPTDSKMKLVLGGSLFVVLNVLAVYVASCTKYPIAVVFAVSFLQTTMYLVATTILLQVCVIGFLASQSGPSRPSPLLMHALTGSLGKYLMVHLPSNEHKHSTDDVQLEEEAKGTMGLTAKQEWMMVAMMLDRVFFVQMLLTMTAVHHL